MLQKTSNFVSWRNFARFSAALSNKEQYASNLGKKVSEKPVEWDSAKPYENIPGPKPTPIVGNTWQFLFGDLNIMQDLMTANKRVLKKYGDIVAFRKLGPMKDLLLIYNPSEIEKMYRNEGAWPSRDGFNSISRYRNVIRKDIFGDTSGLLTSQNEEWHNFRSKVNPILLQPRTAEQYISSMDSVADDFIERIKYLRTKNTSDEMPANFDNELNKWAFESIGVIALDRRLGCLDKQPNTEAQTMVKYMVEMFKMMHTLDFTPFGPLIVKFNLSTWRRFVKYQDYFTNLALKYIDEAAEKINCSPNYDMKPESEKSAFEKFLKIDKKIAVTMTLDMLSAGIDTTGKVTGATLYFLAKNKEVQSKLRNELLQILPSKDSPVTKTVLDEAKYLKATIREAMRIAPINGAGLRSTTKPVVLNGYQIPIGVNVVFPNLFLSNNDDHYIRAKEFLPDRWLRTTECNLSHKNVNPFITLPFGFGPRSCIGQRLALLEMEIVVAKIIRNFILNWPHKDMKFGQEMLYGFQDPLKLHVTETPN